MDNGSAAGPAAQHEDKRFEYSKLDYSKNEFRLIRIDLTQHAASGVDTPPSFTIQHFPMEDAPSYGALSYVWGDSSAFNKILLNGLSLEVSDNLFDFLVQHCSTERARCLNDEGLNDQGSDEYVCDTCLSHLVLNDRGPEGYMCDACLRHFSLDDQGPDEDTTPWLWIDQLCIDQSSVSEKNHQVAHMGHIFSEATKVIVWLGKGTYRTEEAVRVLAEYGTQQSNKGDSGMSALQACCSIASNQYWTRLWIIQEFVLARNIIIMSGSAKIRGARFQQLAKEMASRDKSLAIVRIFPILISQYKGQGKDGSGRTETFTWRHALRLGKNAKCRNVRDRVYGLLALVDKDVRINVDYEAPLWHIHENIIQRERYAPYRAGRLPDEEDFALFRLFDRDLEIALSIDDEELNMKAK